jgi:hypothetical protein
LRRTCCYSLHVLTLLSLVLCITTSAVWVRSYWYTDDFAKFERRGQRCRFFVSDGMLGIDNLPQVTREKAKYLDLVQTAVGLQHIADAEADSVEREKRLTATRHWMAELRRFPAMSLPWSHTTRWALPLAVVAFALAPAMKFVQIMRTGHRRDVGACLVCGYDLRATPDRCPECGKVPVV